MAEENGLQRCLGCCGQQVNKRTICFAYRSTQAPIVQKARVENLCDHATTTRPLVPKQCPDRCRLPSLLQTEYSLHLPAREVLEAHLGWVKTRRPFRCRLLALVTSQSTDRVTTALPCSAGSTPHTVWTFAQTAVSACAPLLLEPHSPT